MSRIAIVTHWYPSGGGFVSKAFYNSLIKNHDVFIYARGGKRMIGDIHWDWENVTWAPRHPYGTRTNHLIKWVKKNRIEIVLFNEQRYWKPVLALKKNGIKIGIYIDYYKQSWMTAFAIYDFLICNTKRHYSVFSWHSNCIYIPWGTSLPEARKEFNIGNSITFIHSSGWETENYGDRRGTLLLLKAFSRVRGDCKLLIYSQVHLNKWKDVYTEWINDDRIEIHFGTFDPFPYRSGDVYVYPSRLDGIGLTLPEALCHGLPVITTDSAPMNEFVVDDFCGRLVKVDRFVAREDGYYWAQSICDIEDLTLAMQEYVNNRELVNLQSQNARVYAEKNLNWEVNSNELCENINNIHEYKHGSNESIYSICRSLDRKQNPTILDYIYRSIAMFINMIKAYLGF